MAAALTVLDGLALQPLQVLHGQIPIVVKYNQLDIANVIRDWCDTQEFLQFAVDNLCAYSQELGQDRLHRFVRGLQPGQPHQFPAGLTWPFTPDQFTPLTPEKIAFLKNQLYKVTDLQVWPARDGVRIEEMADETVQPNGYIWQRVIPEEAGYLSNWTYCTIVPEALLRLLTISALRTNTLLPHERRIIGIDIFLNRQYSNVLGEHGWHSDKLAGLGDPAPGRSADHTAENVNYISLLMLMRDGIKGKSTTFTSNAKATGEHVFNGVPYKHTLTLPVQQGSCVLGNDDACFHASPHTKLVKQTVDATSGLLAYDDTPVTILQTPSPLVGRLTTEEMAQLETPQPRSFLRVHFIDHSSKYYQYTDFPEADGLTEHYLSFAEIQPPTIAPVDTVQLDQTKSITSAFENAMATILKQRSIGGTKRRVKKNKTLKRGGGIDNFIISFDIKDFYFFRKERTGLFINLT